MSRWLTVGVLGLLGLGCDDLEDFKTTDSKVFHGVVIGSDSEESEESFIRQGFGSHTELVLTFDPELASTYLVRDAGVGPVPAPGTITTFSCPEDVTFCSGADRTAGHFTDAILETFANLPHDSLSKYTFPGGGRVRNYMFGARFVSAGSEADIPRHAMVFLSLMDSQKIEVRILAPSAADPAGGSTHDELFGVFSLDPRTKK